MMNRWCLRVALDGYNLPPHYIRFDEANVRESWDNIARVRDEIRMRGVVREVGGKLDVTGAWADVSVDRIPDAKGPWHRCYVIGEEPEEIAPRDIADAVPRLLDESEDDSDELQDKPAKFRTAQTNLFQMVAGYRKQPVRIGGKR